MTMLHNNVFIAYMQEVMNYSNDHAAYLLLVFIAYMQEVMNYSNDHAAYLF